MRRPSAMGGGATYSVPVLRRTPGGPPLPPSPLPLPRWGRGRGRALPSLPPRPFTASLVARRARSRTGRGRFPTCPLGGWTRGHMRGVGVAPSPSPGPLPLPRWGRGRGRALPLLPLAPFLSHTGSGRGDVGGLARKHGGPRTQWLRAGSAGLWPAS